MIFREGDRVHEWKMVGGWWEMGGEIGGRMDVDRIG